MDIYELELKKTRTIEYDGPTNGSNTESIHKMLLAYGLHKQTEERLILLTFDVSYELTGIFEITHGTPERSLYELKDILKRAMMVNASGIVIAHNHTAAKPEPSEHDIEFTKELAHCCTLMGYALLDHMILGKTGEYYSIAESGELKGMGDIREEAYEKGYRDGLDIAGVDLKVLDENSRLRKKRLSEISKQTIRKNRK